MHDHLIVIAGLGVATLLMAWLPSISRKIKISYPILLLLIGFALFYLDVPLLWPDPLWPDDWIMYISELVVIISLMGAGLKIGSDYSWKHWVVPVRLVAIAMPLCMVAAFFGGYHLLSLSLPGALLLAAVLAPTDPVLAAEVQIRDLDRKEEHNTSQFALTGEAGINDGLAFPFTFLAVLVVKAGSWEEFDFTGWLLDEFFLKIMLGVAIGYAIGRGVGWLIWQLPEVKGIKNPHGFVSLSITLATYGVTELLHGYGFLAVFVAALSIRHREEVKGEIKEKMHDFIEEIERLLLVIWLVLFGGSILNGILAGIGWREVAFALGFILLVRPLSGWLAVSRCVKPRTEKLITSFYGIRGIGTFFYLSWAFYQTDLFEEKQELYTIASLVILCSIVIHGLTAPYVMANYSGENEEG